MTKKQMLKDYLKECVNFNGLYDEWSHSWLADKPKEWLYNNGIVSNYFTLALLKEAIAYAGYKYPRSNRTWETVYQARQELINEYVFLIKGAKKNENIKSNSCYGLNQ